jgi:hypothetical protein
MHSLRIIASGCGAICFFMLALTRTDDGFWQTSWFVLAALHLVVLALQLFH